MLRHVLIVAFVFSQVTYKLKRMNKELDTFEYIGERKMEDKTYKFWLGKDKELSDAPGHPEMTNKLMNCPVLTLSKKDKIYEIDPFKYVKMYSQEGEFILGYFSELKYIDKNLVCIYTGGDNCDCDKGQKLTAKVVFCRGKGEPEIEKYFSGEPSEYVLKVTGDFLVNKRQTATVYYVVIDKEGKVEEESDSLNKEEPKKTEEMSWTNFTPEMIEKLKSLKKKNKKENVPVDETVVNERDEI